MASLESETIEAAETLQKISLSVQHNIPELRQLIWLFDSSLLHRCIRIQDSLKELRENANSFGSTMTVNDFDINDQGELVILHENGKTFNVDEGSENDEFEKKILEIAKGREIHIVSFKKIENQSLGFSIVGLEKNDGSGLEIVIQNIDPEGLAGQENKLKENDQILSINGEIIVNGQQQAMEVLKSATFGQLTFIIARNNNSNGQSIIRNIEDIIDSELIQVEVIDLINDGTGLGFGITGDKLNCVKVKTILEDGIASRDGRLYSGDIILMVGEWFIEGMSTSQVAAYLQEGSHVRLVVARPVLEENVQTHPPYSVVIYTKQLKDHLQKIYALGLTELVNDRYQQMHSTEKEENIFEVELVKAGGGLGIIIAGLVGSNSDGKLSGIYVRQVAPGSAASLDGRILPNDRIVEVNGKSLEGFSNIEAVDVLKSTGDVVRLKLARLEKDPMRLETSKNLSEENTDSSNLKRFHEYQDQLVNDAEDDIKKSWENLIHDPDSQIIIAHITKFKEGGGLGISLEGTVDVENGKEVRPHHYLRSIHADGPVGSVKILKESDELLEVNGRSLVGLNHKEVVEILKQLPQNVRIVCCRKLKNSDRTTIMNTSISSDKLFKAKSEASLNSESKIELSPIPRWRSAEPLTAISLWSDSITEIILTKGEKGLGFSVLDYQDPLNPDNLIIIVRSLVPGGVAQMDGRLIPGDRLMYVNDIHLENACLEDAVSALKGAPLGPVKIGLVKPLSADIPESTTDDLLTENNISNSQIEPILSVKDSKNDKSKLSNSITSTKQANEPFTLPKTVIIDRKLNESLGISIVGGKMEFFPTSSHSPQSPKHSPISGIFIKHVLSTGPAAGHLKMGDQILEVDDHDIRKASHDEAVEIIKNAKSPVKFVIQSIIDQDSETTEKPPEAIETVSMLSAAQLFSNRSENIIQPQFTKNDEIQLQNAFVGVDLQGNNNGYNIEHVKTLYGHLGGNFGTAFIQTTKKGELDLNLVNSKENLDNQGVFVAGIGPKIDKHVELEIGDQILEINGHIFLGVDNLQTASNIIKTVNDVKLYILYIRHLNPFLFMSTNPVSFSDIDKDESFNEDNQNDNDEDNMPMLEEYSQTLLLVKGQSGGLGFAIKERQGGIFVRTITPGGVADVDGRLKTDDRILGVGDNNLENAGYDEALDVLRNVQQGPVKLIISRSKINSNDIDDETFNSDSAETLQNLDPTTCPILEGTETLIKIFKGNNGLGLSIIGGSDTQLDMIYIHEVYENGAAAQDGRLQVGDRILEVDNNSLCNVTHEEAISILRKTRTEVNILVLREDNLNDSSVSSNKSFFDETYDIIDVQLIKRLNKGLGLSIVGRRDQLGVYISELFKGGTADLNGQLKPGDRLLKVNKTDLRNASHEEAATILKTLKGEVNLTVGRQKGVNSTPNSSRGGSLGSNNSTSCLASADLPEIVTLKRGPKGLGFTIVGGCDSPHGAIPIYVKTVSEDGAAAKYLQAGCELLSVNGHNLQNVTHTEAVTLIKHAIDPIELLVKFPTYPVNTADN